MPTPATSSRSSGNGGGGGDRATMPVVPFVRASGLHREPTGIDVSRVLTASDQNLGVFDIPAIGYLRNLVIRVEASGGTGGAPAVTVNEDCPFNLIKNIQLTEPNGAQIVTLTSGHSLAMVNKYGGYFTPNGADPRANARVFSNFTSTFASAGFIARIPLELNQRNALGALANQNAAATFKLRLTLAGTGDLGTGTFPTTLPTVRVRVYTEAWDQPELSMAGQQNQTSPPAINTTQFWTEQVFNVTAGLQTLRMSRVGNYIRNLIFIYRGTSNLRSNGDTNWPDPSTILLDTRPIDIVDRLLWSSQMFERGGGGRSLTTTAPANDTAGGQDYGVWVYDFTHEFDGGYGRELNDLWLPTLGSTRLELQGTFGQTGTVTVLTNDVAIAGNVWV